MIAIGSARYLRLAVAIFAATSAWSPASDAQGLTDVGRRGTDPWVMVCDRRSCIGTERAMSAFFNVIYERYGSWGENSNLYGLGQSDSTSLLTISTLGNGAVVAHRQRLASELCSRPTTIHTQGELAAVLKANARSARELAGEYGEELYSQLSLAGRDVVDRAVDDLLDVIHTVDLDYATYFAAASISPKTYFGSACGVPFVDQEAGVSEIATGDSRRSKPDTLPLAVFVGPDCPVSVELVRESAEGAISQEKIEPLGWPALQEGSGWFGAYVGLECDDSGPLRLRLSLIDSIDGSLDLHDAFVDGSDSVGLGSPRSGGPISYPSFVSRAINWAVSRFLRARFELP